jgi:hypothetical protein
LLDRAQEDPKVARTILDAQQLHTLLEDPGWKKLNEIVRRGKSRLTDGLARKILAGQKVSPEEIAYMRGYIAGSEWAASHPAQAIKSLERAATVAWLQAQQEEADSLE